MNIVRIAIKGDKGAQGETVKDLEAANILQSSLA